MLTSFRDLSYTYTPRVTKLLKLKLETSSCYGTARAWWSFTRRREFAPVVGHIYFHRDFYAYRVLPLSRTAASFQRASRGDTEGALHGIGKQRAWKNRNAYVARLSVGDHQVTRVDRTRCTPVFCRRHRRQSQCHKRAACRLTCR